MVFKMPIFLLGFLILSNLLQAQSLKVSGKVSSTDQKDGLPGVTIMIKGSTTGTITNFDGIYSLNASPGDTLTYSFVGYIPENRVVSASRTTLDVMLAEDIKSLEEIVVIGYGTQKKSDLTGAISSISSEQLSNRAINRVEQALGGQMAGVQVTQASGQPGAGVTVRIRGVGTVNNSDPLYVVDGMPLRDIAYLNPGDIESIEVLKDASAAAIYGSRGANGVVLITTKTGSGNKTRVTYNAYVGMQELWRKPEVQDRDGYVALINESRTAGGQSIYEDFEPGNVENLANTDWIDAITRRAPTQDHHLSVTGGSEKLKYSTSIGYMNQEGIVLNSGFERYSFRLNVDAQINKKLKWGANMGITSSNRELAPNEGSFRNGPLIKAMIADPTMPVRREDGEFWVLERTDFANPIGNMTYFNDDRTENRMVGSVYADYQIFEGLSFRSSLGLDARFRERKQFAHEFDMSTETVNWDRLVSFLEWQNDKDHRLVSTNLFTYTKKFGKHDISAVAGYTLEKGREEFIYLNAENTQSNAEKHRYLGTTNRSSFQLDGSPSEQKLESFLGRINYVYNNKYLLTASLRRDESWKFTRAISRSYRIGYFPSFSAGWKLSEEAFIKDNFKSIELLKIRAGWGQIGNQEVDDYAYTSLVQNFSEGGAAAGAAGGHGLDYPFGEERAQGWANLVGENPGLRWETTQQFNVGVDAEFWQGKLSVTTDYYVRTTKDMLVTIAIPGSTGFDAPPVNGGSVENRGFEFATTYRNKVGDFKYEIGGNITFLQNEVTSLGQGGEPIFAAGGRSRTDVGDPIASFYGYTVEGVFQSTDQIEEYNARGEASDPYQTNAEPGDFIFKDIDGRDADGELTGVPDGRIDEADQRVVGNPHPDFIYGINASASYKNFDLSISLQGVQGNEIFYSQLSSIYFGARSNFSEEASQRWTPESPSNTHPRLTTLDKNNNARNSDFYLRDGSFLRLRNVQLGYTLPKALSERLNIERLRIYLAGQNLLTFTKYPGFDPEIGDQGSGDQSLDYGIDRATYPLSRVYMIGVNLNF